MDLELDRAETEEYLHQFKRLESSGGAYCWQKCLCVIIVLPLNLIPVAIPFIVHMTTGDKHLVWIVIFGYFPGVIMTMGLQWILYSGECFNMLDECVQIEKTIRYQHFFPATKASTHTRQVETGYTYDYRAMVGYKTKVGDMEYVKEPTYRTEKVDIPAQEAHWGTCGLKLRLNKKNLEKYNRLIREIKRARYSEDNPSTIVEYSNPNNEYSSDEDYSTSDDSSTSSSVSDSSSTSSS